MSKELFQEPQQLISSYVGRLLRENFGKGPESVFVSLGHTFITIYIRNFLSPAEKVLKKNDQMNILITLRQELMDSIESDIKNYIEVVTENKLQEMYFDWDFHNKTGVIVGISETPFNCGETIDEEFPEKDSINQEIIKLSHQSEKAPEEIYACQLNPRTIIVLRNGILVRIEKELIRLGHSSVLKTVKRNLEKSYLHNNIDFESILQKKVIDSFVDWDFELDKSVIVLIMNPKRKPKTLPKVEMI